MTVSYHVRLITSNKKESSVWTSVRKMERTEVHTTNESYRGRSTGHDITLT
ncbi:MAG: hypothetical protein MUE44_15075 [Oscillatoriaceae cyanobacterium Prado104]|nr:hypothetical protein [Oscillatoriaceae cyanobacterium Prado104]